MQKRLIDKEIMLPVVAVRKEQDKSTFACNPTFEKQERLFFVRIMKSDYLIVENVPLSHFQIEMHD